MPQHSLSNRAAVGSFLPDSGYIIRAPSAVSPPAQPDEPRVGAWEMGSSHGPAATETTRDLATCHLTTCHLATWQVTCPRASRTSEAEEGLTRESRIRPSAFQSKLSWSSCKKMGPDGRGACDIAPTGLPQRCTWESCLTGATAAGPPRLLPGISFQVCLVLLVPKGSHTHSTWERFWRCYNRRSLCFNTSSWNAWSVTAPGSWYLRHILDFTVVSLAVPSAQDAPHPQPSPSGTPPTATQSFKEGSANIFCKGQDS